MKIQGTQKEGSMGLIHSTIESVAKSTTHIQWTLSYPNTMGPTSVHISEKFRYYYVITYMYTVYVLNTGEVEGEERNSETP